MKKFLTIILALCLLATLLGCNNETAVPEVSDEPQALSIVYGATEVFPHINPNICYDYIYPCMYAFGEVSLFVCDAVPQIGIHGSVTRPENLNNAKHLQMADTYTADVMQMLSQQQANDPETDALEAIHKAAGTLHSSGKDNLTMLIISSGLNTSGAMNFAQYNLLEVEPSYPVEALKDINQLPNLEGIDVIWLGMGQTAGHQASLDNQGRTALRGIWTAVLEAGNPKSLSIVMTELDDIAPAEGLPHCSEVPIVKQNISGPDHMPIEVAQLDEGEVICFDEQSICFVPDQAEFLNYDQAVQELTPVGKMLAGQPGMQVVLAGSTASVGGDGIRLSLSRAEAVKAVLVEQFGVCDNQIQCIGLGRQDSPLRTPDLDVNGNLIEENAMRNRAVFLFSSDSDIARDLGI